MKFTYKWLFCLFLLGVKAISTTCFAAESSYNFAHGKVELVSAQKSIDASGSLQVGVHFWLEPGWHIYGKQPGEVGLPTQITWQIPNQVNAQELKWPEVQKFNYDGIESFGYEHEVTLPFSFSGLNDSGALLASAKINWVLCQDECIPGKAELGINLSDQALLASLAKPALFANGPEALPTNESLTLLSALCFAFIGGLILNLMPCVFPILSIKVLSYVNHAGSSEAKKHGLIFGAGVIVSFWILAALLFGLRAGGAELGWGFQFQSPVFVALMAMLLFSLGLSLMGMFEFGSSLQNMAGKVDTSHGYSGSFMSGVLATVLSTPCTAPFMGTALAAALALPAAQALLIFTTLGIGMAAPYVLLTFFPKLARFLPRPGNWMVTFKELMAFPIFASVIWLVWVLGQQAGSDGVICFLGGLLVLTLGFWLYAKFGGPMASVRRRRFASAALVTCALIAIYIALPIGKVAEASEDMKPSSGAQDPEQIQWQPFNQAKLDQLLAEKKSVLVNFTARWCLTCQMNHKMVYDCPSVNEKLKEKKIIAMRGDWTNKNPEITKIIRKFSRSGVPMDIFFPAEGKPHLFSSVLSKSDLLETLDQAG